MTRSTIVGFLGGLSLLIGAVATAATAAGTVLVEMGPAHGFKANDAPGGGPAGTITPAEGEHGPAVQFSFNDKMTSGYIGRWIVADQKWDEAAGLSFWVRGDGSDSWGGIELIDGNDYSLRYAYCFPIDSKEWKKIAIPWSELTPTMAGPLVNTRDGFHPSSFRNLWFGKGYYWRDYPAHSFAISQIALESAIEQDTKDYTPEKAGVPRFLAKLRAGQPVTIVTMGDSLTDKRHWANVQKDWNEQLAKQIEEKYHGKVTLVNPAIGGTTLSQNLVVMPRWLKQAPHPDLVTICFGFNDWDSKVRKPQFKQYLNLAVDRIRRATGGQAEILLMTTCPAFARWETMDELCQAASEVAQERKTGLADINSAFRAAGSSEEALKRQYWVSDNTHMGSVGHDLITQTMLSAIEAEAVADPKTLENAPWAKAVPAPAMAAGETSLTSFETQQDTLVSNNGGTVVQEHATQGKNALCLTSNAQDYIGISLQDGSALTQLKENSRLLVDVFNPQDKDVAVEVNVKDARSTDYDSRYNGTLTAKPGQNTLDLDYTKLVRSGSHDPAKPDHIDPKQITLMVLFLGPRSADQTVKVYVDNVRLAAGSVGN